MADITLVCPGCGTHVSVSEYVDAATPCPQCGRSLDKHGAQAPATGGIEIAKPDKPRLASMLGRDSLAQPGHTEQPPPDFDRTTPQPAQRRQRGRNMSSLQLAMHYTFSWLFFIALLGLFIYWQWKGQGDAQILSSYKAARWWFAAGAWLAIIVAAFQDTWVQGVLCLLIPPYTIYYALNRLDHFYLRAFYFAVLLMLAAEFYFLPKQTVLHIAQDQFSSWTGGVRDTIRRTGHKITD